MSGVFFQNICEWNARVVARRPKLVLVLVCLVSTTCLTLSLILHPLPSFSDPNLGFETRGTELSKRLISFENLLESRFVRSLPISQGLNHPSLLTKTAHKRRRRRAKKTGRSSMKFCLQPSLEYSQIVMSGSDLWSVDSVKAMCHLELKLIAPSEYRSLCDKRRVKSKNCCPAWSLPNYIAFLHNRTSCLNITEEDIISTRDLVKECHQYYLPVGTNYPVYMPKEVPVHCKRKQSIFNITFLLLDSNYMSSSERLENVLVILPLAQSSAVLGYYQSIAIDSFRLADVFVSAVNFGVKDALFSDMLLKDSLLLLIGAGLVTLCFYLYTDSVMITIATLLALVFSLSLAYFFYTVVLRLSFFPFINLLSSVVVIGVGGDASLILCKVWWSQKQFAGSSNYALNAANSQEQGELNLGLADQVLSVYRSSTQPLILTSLTTAAAFFASSTSSITSIACFGLFSGSVVLSNLVVTWWWMPSCLVLHGARKTIQQETPRRLGKLVLAPRILWLIIFPVVTGWAGFVLLRHGGLPVQDKHSLQLLLPSHPFEKFHSLYSHKFWMYKIQESWEKVVLRWVWGVEAVDTGNSLDPDYRGSLQLDKTFNFSHPDSQLFLYNFCRSIRREEWYGGSASVVGGKCFPESLAGWMSRRCVSESDSPCCGWPSVPPYPSYVYSECAVKAAQTIQHSLLAHPVAGPYFTDTDSEKAVQVLVVEFKSNQTFTTSFTQMNQFYQQVEDWTRKKLYSAPHSAAKGWFLSDLFLYDLQSSLRYDTAISLVTAVTLVLILLTAATRDLRLAAAAVLTVSGSTLSVAAILLLLGWRLDVLESTTASLAVGLAVDFTIHYALHYKRCKVASETLDEVGGPTLVCMITSCLAGLVMIPSQVLPYRRVAVFLLVLMPVSWLYSTLWFLSLLPRNSSKGVS